MINAVDAAPGACPGCAHALANLRGFSWCPECEWGLDRFAPDRHPQVFGWGWLDRRLHRAAYRLNHRRFQTLMDAELPAGPSLARTMTIVASVVVLGGVLAMGAGGLLLIVTDFPSLTIVPGAFLVLFALVLRPRFGRLDPQLTVLTRDQAPTLFQLIDRVADALQLPRPQVVGCHREVNASAGAVGLRRRRALSIGLPLWLQLGPSERVALLAHELGHFANGDVRRGPITQPALLTLGAAAGVIQPNPAELARTAGLHYLATLVMHALLQLVSNLLWTVQLALLWLGRTEAQRAEYLADDRAATVAGTRATLTMLDSLITAPEVTGMLARQARQTGEVSQWRAAAAESRRRLADELPLRRQFSIVDETSLFATHPPTTFRHRMVETRPARSAVVVLSEAESDRIDDELAPHYARGRRDLGAMRYHG